MPANSSPHPHSGRIRYVVVVCAVEMLTVRVRKREVVATSTKGNTLKAAGQALQAALASLSAEPAAAERGDAVVQVST